MQFEARMDGIRDCLFQLKRRLEQRGYRFREPAEVLPGPSSQLEFVLERLRREMGPVPYSLELFYRKIGSVNFLGDHPNWKGCQYPDALVVYPVTVALDELNDYFSVPYPDAFGEFRIPIAPDKYHKEDVSGGMWYGIALHDTVDDPPLLEEWHQTTFVRYLEICVRWGGFPGLQLCSSRHSWPIKELTRGLELILPLD
jgi:hypothetical protein